MRKVLAISPHLDDAVLSAGQFMAGRPDVDVFTVFSGFPRNLDVQTPYDKKCGFKDARDAVVVRRVEDNTALALLKANPIHTDLPDSQYKDLVERQSVKTAIYNAIQGKNYEFIIAPLGLGHPDHEIVAELLRELDMGLPVYLWEDLPLRVVEPELVNPRLDKLRVKKLVSIGTGPIVDKIRALSCYKSQIGTGILDPYVMYVPERFWLLSE